MKVTCILQQQQTKEIIEVLKNHFGNRKVPPPQSLKLGLRTTPSRWKIWRKVVLFLWLLLSRHELSGMVPNFNNTVMTRRVFPLHEDRQLLIGKTFSKPGFRNDFEKFSKDQIKNEKEIFSI